MGSRLEKGSDATKKFIDGHTFNDEEGEEYEPSKFGGFPEYFRRKKIKLQNLDAQLRAESADKPRIFKGVVANVNGYTQPSLNDLHTMIVSHGGGFIQYLDGKTQVTHIIASSLTPKKAVEFKRYRIVKPAWVVDSIRAGKLLPWNDYRVVDEGAGQKVLTFEDGKIASQANLKQRGYKDQTDASWYTEQLKKPQDAHKAPGTANSQLLTPGLSSPVPGPDPGDEEGDGKGDDDYFPGASIFDEQGPSAENELEAALDSHLGAPAPAPSSAVESHGGLISPSEERQAELVEDVPIEPSEGASPPNKVDTPVQSNSPFIKPDHGGTANNIAQATKRPAEAESIDSPATKKAKTLTAEEHNAILLSDPHMRKSSVVNPDFLEQYYRESRLHHLSTWKAELKSHFQAMTADRASSQKARQKRAPGARRYVLHVDFDSFFVAVSLKKHPQYVEKPAVVAHGSGSGSEIASCNYPARKHGVKNGMWMKRALELCPDIKVLPYDFPGYEAASKLFYEAIMDTGGLVQSVSIDEALVDVTTFCISVGGTDGTGVREGSIWREQEKAEEIARNLRDRVKDATGCAVSVGIGGNILLAKVALRKAKPAGQYHVKPDEALSFLGDLEVQDLPGVAYSIGGKLEEIGIRFVKDIREVSRERLVAVLGPKTGEKIYNYARGIDKTEVGDQVIRKSVSAEVNWGVRFENNEQVDEFIESLCGELTRRLLKEGVRGKQLTMKVMRRAADAPLDPPKNLGHGKCDVFNKSVALGVASNAKEVLAKEALSILRSFGFSPGELRGLGVQMTKLEPMKASGPADGSQPRLHFAKATVSDASAVGKSPKAGDTTAPAKAGPDDLQNLANSQQRLHFKKAESVTRADEVVDDHDAVIDDPETPQKRKSMPGQLTSMLRNNSPSSKPLNTAGTQFILPTQVDPQVLAELPDDIRARLAKQHKPRETLGRAQEQPRAGGVASTPIPVLPRQSQIDPEILGALPDELREEILAEYDRSPSRRKKGDQQVLPQSPRKTRAVVTGGRKSVVGRGRARGGGLLNRLRGAGRDTTPTLTQANFVAPRGISRDPETDSDSAAVGDDGEGISPEFLAALPMDIRQEVLAEHRREQLKRKGGLEVLRRRGALSAGSGRGHGRRMQQTSGLSDGGADTGDEGSRPTGERVVELQAKRPRATFTVRKLWRADELREAITAWTVEFAEEGPYAEDVEALSRYLHSVIVDEGDLNKAVSLVGWFDWQLGRQQDDQGHTQALPSDAAIAWGSALEGARHAVREAARQRGLGEPALP